MVISIGSDGMVDTFPENKEEVCAILMKYDLASNKVANKSKQNSESMLQSQILKMQLELNRLRTDNENPISVTSEYLDSMLGKVQRRIMLKSYGKDFVFGELLESSVDVGKLSGEKEREEVDVEMATKECTHCNEHDNLPIFFGIDELLTGIDSSSGDINDMQIAVDEASCHKYDEFSTDDLQRSNYSLDVMNDPRIVTPLAIEESNQLNVFSCNCTECSEPVSNTSCYVDDDFPYLFELSDFFRF